MNLPRDLELPMEKSDFRLAANKLEASRDVGAQLFCALLRSAGVDARLLCSLQPLPFTATLKGTMQEKPNSAVVTYPDTHTASSDENSAVQKSLEDSTSIPRSIESSGGRRKFISNITTRLGQHPSSNLIQEPVPTAPIPSKSSMSPHPKQYTFNVRSDQKKSQNSARAV